MNASTTWSIGIWRKSVITSAVDPDHCLLVNGALNVTCRNDGQYVTRQTTTATSTTTTTSPDTVTPSRSVTSPTVRTTLETVTPLISTTATSTSTKTTTAVSVTVSNPQTDSVGNVSKPVTVPTPTTSTTPVMADNQDTIIIGASIGAVILLIIILVIVWRCCCWTKSESEKYHQDIPPNPIVEDVSQATPDMSYSNTGYTPYVPDYSVSKTEVTRSQSSPPSNPNLSTTTSFVNGTPFTVTGLVHVDGTSFKESPGNFHQHELEVFNQGIKNTEMVNNGDTIEANHKYISKVVQVPYNSGYYSYPNSRSNSVKRPEDTTLRNTERLQDGNTIEAEHKYITTIGVPMNSGYYSHPHSRANSFKRPVQIMLSYDEALRRKESWYRNGGLARQKAPLSYSRSKSGSAHLGAL